MRLTKPIACACALGLLAVTATAGAQTGAAESRISDDQYYRFETDDLLGDTFGTPPPILRGPPKGRRVLFLRPRVSFVGELLQSVEVM